MSADPIDTLRFAETLEAAGTPPAQAKATARAFSEALARYTAGLATNARLNECEQAIRNDTKELDGSLHADMKTLEASLRADMKAIEASLRGDMKTLEASLRGEIDGIRIELRWIRWLLGLMLGGIASLMLGVVTLVFKLFA